MTDPLNDILNFDALAKAETITGKSYKDDTETMNLGLMLLIESSRQKEEQLSARKDTYRGIKYADALEIIKNQGFAVIYEEEFIHESPYNGDDKINQYKILWRDGILLTFESYGENTVNNAKLYYNWVPRDRAARQFMSSGHTFTNNAGEDTISGYHDVREGFVNTLSQLEENGTFLSVWEDGDTWLWLKNFVEEKDDRLDYGTVNLKKMNSFPDEVKTALAVVY